MYVNTENSNRIAEVSERRLPAGILSAVLFTLIMICSASPALAQQVPEFIKIPIYFVSDRNKETGKIKKPCHILGGRRKYERVCAHDPFMGSAYFVIQNTRQKELTKKLADLGWTAATEKKEGVYETNFIEHPDFQKIELDFYGKVANSVSTTEDSRLFIFVPGYMGTFESGLISAGVISYFVERPLILYSWPSLGKFRYYTADESSIEWSQEHFNDFLDRLKQMNEVVPALKLHIYAHSMGSRMLFRAMPFLRTNKALAEASLICPDTDEGLVLHYARRYLTKEARAKVNLYVSRRDKMMSLSKWFHGGYERLGQEGDIESSVEQTLALRSKSSEAKQEMHNNLTQRVRTVDFTAIDQGKVGHRIPTPLVTSLSFEKELPESIKLVSEGQAGNGTVWHVEKVKGKKSAHGKNVLRSKDWTER